MVNPHLEEGQVFVEGRSEETARKLIEAADAAKIDRSEISTTSDGYIVPKELSGDFETKSASDYPAVPTEPGTDTDPNKVTNVGGTEQDADEQTKRFNAAAERQASFDPDEPTDKEAVGEYDKSTRLNTTDSDRPTVSEGGVNPEEGDTAQDGTVTPSEARRQAAEGRTAEADSDESDEADQTPTPRAEAEAPDAGNPESDADQFDPADHNVDEVWEYLESADDAERQRVLAAERDGKNRKAFQSETEGDK
jgi:hypothetical protein